MKLTKDLEHSVLLKPYHFENKEYLCVSVLHYFDLQEGKLLQEKNLWQECVPFLREEQPLDEGWPKVNGEVLVYGHCHSKTPVQVREVGFEVGDLKKKLVVYGERFMSQDASFSGPVPFTRKKVGFETAFGGENCALNPIGTGFCDGKTKYPVRLPNVEHEGNLIYREDINKTKPQSFEPISLSWEQRISLSGTYDRSWVFEQWPNPAKDLDLRFYNTALPDQQIEGYFRGDEAVAVHHMHSEHETIASTLPGKKVMVFVTREKESEELFFKADTVLDTVVLFSDIARGVCVYRTLIETNDEEYSDIARLYIQTEHLHSKEKPLEYYQEKEARELDRAVDVDEAAFEQMDAEHQTAMQELRDMPLSFAMSLKEAQGKAPAVSASPRLAVERGVKAFKESEKAWLKAAEEAKEMPELQKAFLGAHAELAAENPANALSQLNTLPQDIIKQFKEAEKEIDKQLEALKKSEKLLGKEYPKFVKNLEDKKLSPALEAKMAEGGDLNTLLINSWQDGAFLFIGDCKELLKEEYATKREQLSACGIRPVSFDIAHIGYNNNVQFVKSGQWAQEEPFEIPKGFVLPYFDNDEVKRLVIRPNLVDEAGNVIGDEQDIEVKGSEPSELVFYGKDESTVVLVNDYIEAVLLYQELWDVCSVALFKTEQAFAESDYAKNSEAALKQVITIYFKMGQQPYETAQLKLDKSIVQDYKEGRPFKEEVINLLRESDHKYALQKELRKQKRMGKFYMPPFDPKAFEADMKTAIEKKVKSGMDKANAELEGVKKNAYAEAVKQNPKLQGELSKIDSAGPVKKGLNELKSDAKKEVAKFKEKMTSINSKDAPKPEEVDKAFAYLDSPEFAKLEQIEPEVQAALAPVYALEQKALMPEWAEKMFQKAFGKKMSDVPLEFHTKEEVLAHYNEGKSFNGAVLKGLELDGCDLSGADFKEADLTGVSLTNAILKKCDFTHAAFSGADLTHANLHYAICEGADFSGAVLNRAKLRKASLKGVIMDGCEMQECTMQQADLSDAIINAVQFKNVNADGALFNDAVLKEAHFSNSALEKAGFVNALATDSQMKHNVMQDAVLERMTLHNTTFDDCELRHAKAKQLCVVGKSGIKTSDFQKADLSQSYFDTIGIEKCSFDRAQLKGAYLKACEVHQCNFESVKANTAKFDKSDFQACDMYRAGMMFSSLRKCSFGGSSLKKANLYGSDFFKTKFKEADLEGANVKMTQLYNKEHYAKEYNER